MNEKSIDTLTLPGEVFTAEPLTTQSALVLLERRWRTVVAAVLLGGVAGVLLSMALPPWYESTARLAVIPVEDPTASFGINVIDDSNATLPIVVAVLRSRSVADQVVSQLGLQQVYRAPTRAGATVTLSSHVNITSDRKSNLITIAAEDHSAERARAITERLLRVATARSAELWAARNHEQHARLEAELAEVAGELRAAEEERREFRDRNGIVDLPAQIRATVEQAARLQKLRVDKRLELHFARGFSADRSVEVRRTEGEHAAASRELSALRRRGGVPFLALEAVPALETEDARHKREIDRLTARHDLVALKLSQLVTAETRSGGHAEPLDPPSQPLRPVRPSVIMLAAQGAAAGGLFAALLVLFVRRRRA